LVVPIFVDMDYNAQFWKSKAVKKNQENKELKKRIKETKAGRERWKAKYIESRKEAEAYKKELVSIKKKIGRILMG